MPIMRRKLIRSRSLVDKMGRETWRFRWTECLYVFGFLVRSIQVDNLNYSEALSVFGSSYEYWMSKGGMEDERELDKTFIYFTNRKRQRLP